MDSRRPAGTDASQEIGAAGDRAGDGTGDPPNSENQPDPLSLSDKTNADNTDNARHPGRHQTDVPGAEAAQLFIITPEALTGFKTVTQAGDATYKALQEYPVGGLSIFPKTCKTPASLKP